MAPAPKPLASPGPNIAKAASPWPGSFTLISLRSATGPALEIRKRAGPPPQRPSGEAPKDKKAEGEVVDADYKVVDEDRKYNDRAQGLGYRVSVRNKTRVCVAKPCCREDRR